MVQPEKKLGEMIRESRVAKGLALRELARRVERAPSYLNDIEHDRRVPSESVLRQICQELGMDIDRALAAAGRVGDGAEQYMKSNPTAGVLFRRVAEAGLDERDLKALLTKAEQLARRRRDSME